MTETEARQVLLLQAFESGSETPVWTADDRNWASRLALQGAGAAAEPERFVVERAGHAMQRLLPRDAVARRWVERRSWRPAWLLVAALLAFAAGVLIDHIGGRQRIDLLLPPVWAVIAWNLVVYVGLLLPRPAAGLRRLLARRWTAGTSDCATLWAGAAAPLALARAALLLHVAAAALAVGLIAGMYLRGLVLDYRAGWQSTFLDAGIVQALLGTLLAPASIATGIAVPDVAPLRLTPGVEASASAAPWIHLYAAMLVLLVLLPRLLLALAAAWRSQALAARFPLPLTGPYFERLRQQQAGTNARVLVLPYAVGVGAQAALGLRALLATVFGDDLQVRVAPVTAFGDESGVAAVEPGTTLRVALFDLAAMPEAESQGRFVAALGTAPPLLLVADEAAFRRRFAELPERLAERRAAWQRLADEHGAGLLCADLEAPDIEAAQSGLQRALQGGRAR